MKSSSLEEGQLITCKPGYYLGSFPKDDFVSDDSPYIPWLVISALDFSFQSASEWVYGSGEVIVYLGFKETQLTLQISEFFKDANRSIHHHEVLWRGSVYRVRSGNFKRLKRFTHKIAGKSELSTSQKKDKK